MHLSEIESEFKLVSSILNDLVACRTTNARVWQDVYCYTDYLVIVSPIIWANMASD